MLTGDNGILKRAGEAKERTVKAQKEEARILSTMEAATNVTETIFEGVKIPAGYAPTRREGESTVNEGLVITDIQGNEFVWIEVPNDGTGPIYPENATDEQIYTALRNYCSDVIATGTSNDSDSETTTCGFTDEWYAWDEANSTVITESSATSEAQKALTNGCGLSLSEYNETKHAMLNSIKENGGFYIGKYETGNSGGKAVIKQNQIPYNLVTCNQAQNLAKGLATDGKQSSLLFGIQWDLVLKFINVKENLGTDNTLLTSNSTTWGNYVNGTFNITSEYAMASSNNGDSFSVIDMNTVKTEDLLLTTGASTVLSKQNIFDLAGNVWEWTLEKTSYSISPCSFRGGSYYDFGDTFPASSRVGSSPTYSFSEIGFRVALY